MLNLLSLTKPTMVTRAFSATATPEDVGAALEAMIGIPTLAIL